MPDIRGGHGLGVQAPADEYQPAGPPGDDPVEGTERADGQQFALHDRSHDDRRCGRPGQQQLCEPVQPGGGFGGCRCRAEAERIRRVGVAARYSWASEVSVGDQAARDEDVHPGECLAGCPIPGVAKRPQLRVEPDRAERHPERVAVAVAVAVAGRKPAIVAKVFAQIVQIDVVTVQRC